MSSSDGGAAGRAGVSAAELEIDRVYAPLYETCQRLLAMEAALPSGNDSDRIFHSEASFVAPDMAEFQKLVKSGVAQWREFRDCVKSKDKALRKVWVPRVRTIKEWLKGLQDKASTARGVVVLETYIPAGDDSTGSGSGAWGDDETDTGATPDPASTQLAMSMLAAPQQARGAPHSTHPRGEEEEGGDEAPVGTASGAWAGFDQLVAAVSTAASTAASTAGSVAGSVADTVASSVSSLVASTGGSSAGSDAGGSGVLLAPGSSEPLAEVDVLRRNWYNRAQRRRLRFYARGWQRVDPESGVVREAFEYEAVTGAHVHAYRQQLAVQLRDHAAEWYEGEGTARVLMLLQAHCHKLAVLQKP